MFRRLLVSKMLNVKRVDIKVGLVTPHYDSIVDRSKFRPNAAVRDRRLGFVSGDSSKALYDFPQGKVQGKGPTDIELALRNGDLDKAEVQVLLQSVKDESREQVEKQALAKRDARFRRIDDMMADSLEKKYSSES